MVSIRYVCEGDCGGKVSEEEFHQGKKKCTTKSCSHFGHQLTRKEYCSNCNTIYEEGEEHFCT